MNYTDIIRSSVDTSITLKLFKSREIAAKYHIFNSELTTFSLSKCKNKLGNFNPERLKTTAVEAYPIENRPRGTDDIKSVKFYQKTIKVGNDIPPIWIVKKDDKFILLDGVHRIVASHIEGKKSINCYIIKM